MSAGASLPILPPKIVDDAVKLISVGTVIDQKVLRSQLPKKYGADHACPVTRAIWPSVVAEAACAEIAGGAEVREETPLWRAVEPGSNLAGKRACGREFAWRGGGGIDAEDAGGGAHASAFSAGEDRSGLLLEILRGSRFEVYAGEVLA